MSGKRFSAFLGALCVVAAVFLAGRALVTSDPFNQASVNANSLYGEQWSVAPQTAAAPPLLNAKLLNGKTASLSWIVGRDCQTGIQAYLQSASVAPDAALVGTGWLDPTTGKLINGQSNTCQAGSLSMDNVVQMVHSKGGLAYLTITMQTDGVDAWTAQQAAAYIVQAIRTPAYIAAITHEVLRAHYDGVIMDLEGVDRTYPSIQQLFATYNQQLWSALRPLHKWYGIALIHKLSDQDAYYNLNGFQDWRLLAHSADFMVVMAVDQSYFEPGPSVSVPWLKQLLAYTLQTMPNMLPHIIWELPLYGNSWHLQGTHWLFDGIVTYQQAQATVAEVPSTQIDIGATNLQDAYAPHLVYTDSSGVKHSLWYLSPSGLVATIAGFKQALLQGPQFKSSHPLFAFWWRTMEEPQTFWSLLAAAR